MLRALICVVIALSLSACVSAPEDPSFTGAREFDANEASKTRVSLGLTYLQNGNFSQAKFNLDKALEFAPRNGQAHYALAFYYQQVDEPKLAEDSYETALRFSNNDPDVVNSYGAFLCQQGNYDKAKEYFLKAVNDRNYVSTAETYENLAICSQSQGKNQEAIEYFNSALNHQPTRAESLYLLTQLYVQEKQWEEAKRTLFKYERNAQVSAETLYLQYQIALGLNDTKTAVGYGEILKSMFPNHSNTKKYLAQMGKFQPSATVTRKIRQQSSSPEPVVLDTTIVENVLSEEDTIIVEEVETQNGETALVIDERKVIQTDNIMIVDTTPEPESESESEPATESEVANDTQSAADDLADDISEDIAETPEVFVSDAAQLADSTLDESAEEASAAIIEASDDVIESATEEVDAASAEISTEQADVATDSSAIIAADSLDVEESSENALDQTSLPDETIQASTDDVDTALDGTAQIESITDADGEAEASIDSDIETGAQANIESDVDSEGAQDEEPEYHTVAAGENLYRISLKYNVKMTTLLEWNNMSDSSSIRIGTVLRVRDPDINE
ncbi:type IV pilus biogenesis/stability protein PilW [Glaciecola siphonariae]|uniref:Type IV pilus biogenesis/stability protein PilW n=1 Tax=Glaciecola siphonariae TaxID=521012 RepID=A0ABV9LZE0_9ALTE